jgi:hypothetical protein
MDVLHDKAPKIVVVIASAQYTKSRGNDSKHQSIVKGNVDWICDF